MRTFADVIYSLGGSSENQSPITGVSSSTLPVPQTLSFIRNWTDESAQQVQSNPETLFLVPIELKGYSADNTFAVANPRLAYAQVLRDVLPKPVKDGIADTAIVEEGAQIDVGVVIGHFVVIESGVVVGSGSSVDSHSVLKSGVSVGSNTRIGSHTVIGGEGFGFEVDENGAPIRVSHRGGVLIGDEVEVGSHVVIAQGTIDPTDIGNHVKIDDCVFIAHNVSIGEASFIIAGAEVSGSVDIGKRVWVSPEVTIINKVSIGDDALVGIGAVVVSDVAPNTVVAGVPAKPRGPRHAP